jgi:hypothetical protein
LLIEPETLQSSAFVTRVPPLVQTGKTYTVNQQLPIALSWCPKGFAAGYALQIATNQSFATTVIDEPYLAEARYAFSSARSNTTYYWRVTDFNDAGLSDWATSAFATIPPTIRVMTPNGGEAWRRGRSYFIEWDDNILESVTIALYKGGTLVKTIATNAPSTVSLTWQIGVDLVPGSDYSLRITSATNGALFDVSDLPFSIVDAPTINTGSITRLPGGHLQFGVTAPGAATTRVQASTNLATWQTIQTLTITNDAGLFTDSSPATLPRRFYRLVVP